MASIFVPALFLIAAMAAALSFTWLRPFILARLPAKADVRRRFNNVYGLSTKGRREAIVRFYMNRDGSTREQAMLSALNEASGDHNR